MRLVAATVALVTIAALIWISTLPTKAECLRSGRLVDPTERHCEASDGYEQLQEHVGSTPAKCCSASACSAPRRTSVGATTAVAEGKDWHRLPNVRCSRRAPSGLPYERLAIGISVAVIPSVDGDALAAELGR